ncbi:hypothetical protein FAZ69_14285 [Trinickia terrae]|uniref:Uncharacterized protein n=1 Tax=Trinickia terrae TaxID=2571161 RepID=A0A4U1I4U0_9BURK|nr:hypothetical protein [Trinickia terrae]TKC88313.1 hypothetical protein FAZ69_14285 [Trinickia terrae]
MSAPESSNSKAPPSLLADAAKSAPPANNARILANLEGRVTQQAAPRRRSKLPFVLAGLLVVAGGGIAAWQLQKPRQADHDVAAVEQASNAVQQKAAAPASAGSAAQLAAADANAQKDAASAPHAATIITDENSDADAKSASASVSGADANPLSRALADGAVPVGASAPAVAASKPAVAAVKLPAASPTSTAHAKRETAKDRHEEKVAAAHAEKDKHADTKKVAAKNDSDADLLEALVARTTPYNAKKPAVPAAQQPADKAQAKKSLAEQVKECGTRGFFEEELCRWRVCDGHWGKDPACPNASAQAKQN